MVVDYRALNRVTIRKVFLIPNSDQIKANVAGSVFISVGDMKEGFNQIDNEPETSKKMAVMTPMGQSLPKGLTFGPTNGPEGFQELVFIIFSASLYVDWFPFLDDLTVATGRPKCRLPDPSGAHDVMAGLGLPPRRATRGSLLLRASLLPPGRRAVRRMPTFEEMENQRTPKYPTRTRRVCG